MSTTLIARITAALTLLAGTIAALLASAGTASAQLRPDVPTTGGYVAPPPSAPVATGDSTPMWVFVVVALGAAVLAIALTEAAHFLISHRHPAPAQ